MVEAAKDGTIFSLFSENEECPPCLAALIAAALAAKGIEEGGKTVRKAIDKGGCFSSSSTVQTSSKA